jgi:hypothetical protein
MAGDGRSDPAAAVVRDDAGRPASSSTPGQPERALAIRAMATRAERGIVCVLSQG